MANRGNRKSGNGGVVAAAKTAGESSNKTTTFLAGGLGVVLIAMAAASVSISSKTSKDQADLQVLSDLRALSYRTMESSRMAIGGDQKAFVELENTVSEMERITTRFADPAGALYAELPSQVQDLTNQWNAVKSGANNISKDEASIILTNDIAKRLNETIPELQREYDNVIDVLVDKNSGALLVSQARRQSWLAERIARNVDLIRFGGTGSQAAADQFNNDVKLFGRYMTGFKDGDRVLQVPKIDDADARTSLDQVIKMFKFVSDSAEQIYKATPNVAAASEANAQLMKDIPVFLEKLGQLNDSVAKLSDSRFVSANLLYVLGALALGLIATIGGILYKGNTERLRLQEQENNSNQQAIGRLMDEIESVSEGDLTTTATVGDAITGEIAQAINTTIESLRDIVGDINVTIDNVTEAAGQSEKIAIELADAADKQNREITGASAKIHDMAESISRVSQSANDSATVAQKSVQYAANGAEMVHKTIEGMNTIREQIQETSKRIKRLGESSQEIGDIVSLINEIAEQTNILALNAAIQAAMAGDAGRGFAVVADEVQRLAERSGAATKQIAALVKTIQTDTSEAVASMEQTTTEVVRGARLAQDAGGALDNIETVSSEMEKLIGDISSASRHQAALGSSVTQTMGVIQDITMNTSKMAEQSAKSISVVGKKSSELVESVAGFKLPNQQSRGHKTRR